MEVSISVNNFNFSKNIRWPELELETPTLQASIRLPRPKGYAIQGQSSLMVKVRMGDLVTEGFADSDETLVEAKAISEALERLVMHAYAKQTNCPDTSNGWACHTSLDQAIQNALCELVERDVSLTSWERSKPLYLIPEGLWPKTIKEWSLAHRGQLEYSHLCFVLSESHNGCAVSAFLFNGRGNCVAAHSSKFLLSEAISSAFMECLRAAHSVLRFEHIAEVRSLHQNQPRKKWNPGAHSVAYAYSVPFPSQVPLVETSASEIKGKWIKHQTILEGIDLSQFEILGFNILDRVVVRLRHPSFRNIYWGLSESRDELINKNPHTVG